MLFKKLCINVLVINFTNHSLTKLELIKNKNNIYIYNLTFCFENPGSMTNTIPSMVSEVSAMFVETTTFLPMAPLARFGGAFSNIRC